MTTGPITSMEERTRHYLSPPTPGVEPKPSGYSENDPATWDRTASSSFIIGLDVGMHTDHSAMVVAAVWPQAAHAIGVVDIKQFPLGLPFEDVADAVAMAARNTRAQVVVDASNNSAFVGVLAARMPQPAANHVIACAISNAAEHASQPSAQLITIGGLRTAVQRWTLSKKELIETLGVELDGKLVRISPTGDWEKMKKELASMERTVRASGSAAYSAPSGQHDDLVLALSLAVFGCRRFALPPARSVYRLSRYRPRAPSSLAWT